MNRFSTLPEQLQKYVDLVNTVVLDLSKTSHVPLGPAYSAMTHEEAQDNLIMHRMAKKFEEPNTKLADLRKNRSLADVLTYDQNGISEFNPAKMNMDPFVRKVLYEVRDAISNHCRTYRFDLGSVEITTGETYVSSNGKTSVFHKLKDRAQWCVTPDCFDLFATVCYKTKWLKLMAKEHFYTKQYEDGPQPHDFKKRLSRIYGVPYANSSKLDGFATFKNMLLDVVTIVEGSRFTTVPKNNEVDRVIECEAMCNMIVQRVIALSIRRMIKDEFSIDLEESQTLHSALILDDTNATIDLSNASNSNWFPVIQWLYSGKLLRHITDSRASRVYVQNAWYDLNMVAPMGNGFTFELMTLTLLHVCRYFDSFSFVYGDDIIVDRDCANQLIEVLSVLGYSTNETKTFVNGSFRESCGGFVSHGTYCVSYEFSYASDILDAIVLVNKLGRVTQFASPRLKKVLEPAYQLLLDSTPLLLFCDGDLNKPFTIERQVINNRLTYNRNSGPCLDDGVIIHRNRRSRLHKKHNIATEWIEKVLKHHDVSDVFFKGICQNTQISTKDLYPRLTFTREEQKAFKKPPVIPHDKALVAHYLYSNRISNPGIGRFKVKTNMVLSFNGTSKALIS